MQNIPKNLIRHLNIKIFLHKTQIKPETYMKNTFSCYLAEIVVLKKLTIFISILQKDPHCAIKNDKSGRKVSYLSYFWLSFSGHGRYRFLMTFKRNVCGKPQRKRISTYSKFVYKAYTPSRLHFSMLEEI